MRLKIECLSENNIVSTSYNRKILSFLKKSLELYDKDIKENYYGEPCEKDMSFSCFFPLQKIESDKISLKENNFKIFITFNSIVDGIHFYNSFVLAKNKRTKFILGDNSFSIKNITKINEKPILEDIAIFKTLSPIVIREKRENEKDWYHFLDEKGIKILKKNICYSLREKFLLEELEKLEIIPIDIKKTVVNFYDIKFTVTKGTFAIKGNRKILEYFYKSGLGSRRSSGFGMLELIK